jgi:hypothetical protein
MEILIEAGEQVARKAPLRAWERLSPNRPISNAKRTRAP